MLSPAMHQRVAYSALHPRLCELRTYATHKILVVPPTFSGRLDRFLRRSMDISQGLIEKNLRVKNVHASLLSGLNLRSR